jgi:hypothetical protein
MVEVSRKIDSAAGFGLREQGEQKSAVKCRSAI